MSEAVHELVGRALYRHLALEGTERPPLSQLLGIPAES